MWPFKKKDILVDEQNRKKEYFKEKNRKLNKNSIDEDFNVFLSNLKQPLANILNELSKLKDIDDKNYNNSKDNMRKLIETIYNIVNENVMISSLKINLKQPVLGLNTYYNNLVNVNPDLKESNLEKNIIILMNLISINK